MQMRTAVVILNWNTKHYLSAFLPALLRSTEAADAVVVVADNASSDGSLEMVKESFPEVRTIALDRNYGFTGGYDRAASILMEEYPSMEYMVLLNSDVDVPRDFLAELVKWMDSHPGCGVCAPKLHLLQKENGSYRRTDMFEYAGAAGGYIDAFGYPFCRGRVLSRTEVDRGQYDNPGRVLWVSGACLMVRTKVWKDLGGLDDRFFAHMEEIDLCWRAQLAGWSVDVVPSSVVWHIGGGTLPQGSAWKLKLNYRNNLLLLDNNLAATYASRGTGAEKARRKARCRIFMRLVLDGLSAAAYLVCLKPSLVRAVRDAHREYRKLRIDRKSLPLQRGSVSGLLPLCIIPLAFLKGRRIFGYLKRYEDSH